MTKIKATLVEVLRLVIPLLIGGIIGALWLMVMPHGM